MIDRGRLGAGYDVVRLKNGGSVSKDSLKSAYGELAGSMKQAGVTSVSGANTTKAARDAVSKAAATAKSSPDIRTMASDLGNIVEIYRDEGPSDDVPSTPARVADTAARASAPPVSAPPPRPAGLAPGRPYDDPSMLTRVSNLPVIRDIVTGFRAGLFSNRDTQRENLRRAGYLEDEIDEYFAKTDATIARNEADALAAARDRDGIMSLPGAGSGAPPVDGFPASPTLAADVLARMFAEGQDITGKTQAELQPLVEQFLRGRGITDLGTYLPKIFETLQVPVGTPVVPPNPTFVAPTDVVPTQPGFVQPSVPGTVVTPSIPPFVPITPVGPGGAYSPPIGMKDGGAVQRFQKGGPALSSLDLAARIGAERGVDYAKLRETARPGTPDWDTRISIEREANSLVTPGFVAMGAPDIRDISAIMSSPDPLNALRSATRQVASSGIDTGVTPARDFYADLTGKTSGTGSIRTELDPTGKFIDVYDAAGNLMRRDTVSRLGGEFTSVSPSGAQGSLQALLDVGASLADVQRLVPGMTATGREFTPIEGNFIRSDAQSMINQARAQAEQRAPLDFYTDALLEAQNIGRMIQQSNEPRGGDPEFRAKLKADYQQQARDLAAKSGFVVDLNTGQLISRPDVPLVPNVTIYPDNLKAMMSPATFAQYQNRFSAGPAPSMPGMPVYGAPGATTGAGQPAATGPAPTSGAPMGFTPITPAAAGQVYSPPPSPGFGALTSGPSAYSPYGQTLPPSFPQLQIPPLSPLFLQYLPPLDAQAAAPLTPQSVPLV